MKTIMNDNETEKNALTEKTSDAGVKDAEISDQSLEFVTGGAWQDILDKASEAVKRRNNVIK